MKKYLVVKNAGLIQAEDIKLLGSSDKRGDDTKIGQFGSGWKYALAWLMRNDCQPSIYAGKIPIHIESRMIQHRSHVVNVIYVDGKETSITTELGLKWTGWMALREIISNAIDEGGDSVKIEEMNEAGMYYKTEDGITTVFIPINKELQEVMDKFKHYFAFERTPDYIHERGFIYLKEKEELVNVYRKGIRCYNPDKNEKSFFDVSFNEINITEDRLLERSWEMWDILSDIFYDCDNVQVIKAAIKTENLSYSMHPSKVTEYYIKAYAELIEEGYTFTTETLSKLLGVVAGTGIKIPVTHFNELIKREMISDPLSSIFSHLDFEFVDVENEYIEEAQRILSLVYGEEVKVFYGEMESYNAVKVRSKGSYNKNRKTGLQEKNLVTEFYIKSTGYKGDKYIKEMNSLEIAAMCIASDDSGSLKIIQKMITDLLLTNK